MSDEFMTLAEAGVYLRVSKETMYRLVKKKEIPFYQLGRKLLFSKEELQKFLNTKRGNNGKEETTSTR